MTPRDLRNIHTTGNSCRDALPCANMALVLGTKDMPSYAHPKWYYQFIENFHVYLQAKNQLHPPCFSEDWLSAFWSINREQEFCQIWDWWWNINNISFHFRSFWRKTFEILNNILKKSKQNYFRANLGPFCSDSVKNEFSWKRGLFQFLNIPIIYHHVENQKKLMSHSWDKCWTDGWTNSSDFIGIPRNI